MDLSHKTQITIVGAGFTGLSAAYELAKKGVSVTVVEAESEIGGLAAAFDVGGEKLDRFYHHWFTNDADVMALVHELGMNNRVRINQTNTGIYYAKNFFKLSTPSDLLKFTAISFIDRIRLGLMTLRVRRIKNWRILESMTAHDWLIKLGGSAVYSVVWQPLLKGKFGPYAEKISAVWFWNKLKLRGGSRGASGEERLVYLKGGFVALADALASRIMELGGRVELNANVSKVSFINKQWVAETSRGTVTSDRVVITTALPLIADMVRGWASDTYIDTLERIKYIGNVCLVLELDRSLSNTYWLNVNDPSFPFVGVIEHTNFEKSETYGGRHIVYLSKYIPHTDILYSMNKNQFLDYALPYLKIMFPSLERSWIKAHHIWKSLYSQPIVEKFYSELIPLEDGPMEGFHICTMAQIYPEDRGTNYAIRAGRKIGIRLSSLV
jgi:protoporphyrinogen oxidase